MINSIQKLMDPIRQRLMLMVGRAVINVVNDQGFIQTMQLSLLSDEVRDNVARLQSYGFTSVPLAGAEAVAIFPGGNRANGIVIGVEDRRYRLTGMAGGEVAIYTDQGDSIHFKRGNIIEIKGGSKVIVTSPDVELGTGTLEKILNGEKAMAWLNSHVHIGDLGVNTSPPTVLMTGALNLSQTVKAAE